ncbi:hypothetical protein EXIGLDRAFT_758949 [Exidia glandulosa HHB12029]|uniref:Uncharacterized protein n=1 Tax=Exidia glandulosa HHB12029 TaxID=1314781 RepID=A0A165QH12_EXIGL|nr:hypothetical protein EXIGLDRAFT_758949 [Exidia glandulosa HHB12029]
MSSKVNFANAPEGFAPTVTEREPTRKAATSKGIAQHPTGLESGVIESAKIDPLSQKSAEWKPVESKQKTSQAPTWTETMQNAGAAVGDMLLSVTGRK